MVNILGSYPKDESSILFSAKDIMKNIWKVEVSISEYYFSTEDKALTFINKKIGKIVKHNKINKDNQKLTCELENDLINVRLIKLNIDEDI